MGVITPSYPLKMRVLAFYLGFAYLDFTLPQLLMRLTRRWAMCEFTNTNAKDIMQPHLSCFIVDITSQAAGLSIRAVTVSQRSISFFILLLMRYFLTHKAPK